MRPNPRQIAEIVESQYDDIAELRAWMAEEVAETRPRSVLSVGEGCHRVSTFVGGCLAVGALPGSAELVVPMDVRAVPDSFHQAGPRAVEGCRLAAIIGSVLAPPLRSGGFDLVASSMMIDDVADPELAVRELLGLVDPSGRLVISGHGIDARPEWEGIPDFLGSNHPDQIYPDQVEHWITSNDATILRRRRNGHTWVLTATPV